MPKHSLNIIDFGIACSLGTSKSDAWKNLLSLNTSGISKKKFYEREFYVALVNGRQNDVNYISNLTLESIAPTVEMLISKFGRNRIAVVNGTCSKSNENTNALDVYRKTGKFPEYYKLEMQLMDYSTKFISKKFNLSGISITHSTACTSSASAFISARNLLASGECDAVIVGGVDIVSDSVILGFSALGAVSPEPSIPFSANRSGITLGEGAAFFVVTNRDDFPCDCRIIGIGESADAEHFTAPNADGAGAKKSMKIALEDAELKPEDIDYINLHGTGTELNDSMESIAVSSLFPSRVPVSSTKSLTGHTLGASGALELAFCCLALSPDNSENFLPPHAWDGIFDSNLPPLHFVSLGEKSSKLKYCMSNSFAFGGCNVSIIAERI